MKNLIDGILIVDKPKEWTSHDVCAFIRSRFKVEKVGHAGTLDPLATGVLVVLLGKATKQSMELSSCDKEYVGALELGVKTDSHDRAGQVLETAPWQHLSLEDVREKARLFTGEIKQVPPMVSALKHQGVRLYKLARRGIQVHREERKITVYRFEIQKKEEALVYFSCHVSKGTYLRTLVNDLGQALGCFGTLADLRRTRSGEFKIEQSITIEALKKMDVEALAQCVHKIPPSVSHENPHKR